jgi:hypothetical protein
MQLLSVDERAREVDSPLVGGLVESTGSGDAVEDARTGVQNEEARRDHGPRDMNEQRRRGRGIRLGALDLHVLDRRSRAAKDADHHRHDQGDDHERDGRSDTEAS